MYPTFQGRIQDGRLEIAELGTRSRIVEGKHIAILALETNPKAQVTGGRVIAGVFDGESILAVDENGAEQPIKIAELEGQPIMVVVRHELLGRLTPESFTERFQLGSKPVEMDN